LEDARFCAAAGADLLGFVQHRKSPRYVAPDRVAEITEWLFGAKTVGVFVDESVDTVESIVQSCGMAYAQLHGNESPEYCESISVPVIKAVAVARGVDPAELEKSVNQFAGCAEYVLLDTHSPEARGGTGRTFEWGVLKGLSFELPFFLAGGLSAANVSEAIAVAAPFGLDVSSSLETAPGIKDFDLLTQFFDSFETAITI
jgi:phosphoribosylanthranilate isomerase